MHIFSVYHRDTFSRLHLTLTIIAIFFFSACIPQEIIETMGGEESTPSRNTIPVAPNPPPSSPEIPPPTGGAVMRPPTPPPMGNTEMPGGTSMGGSPEGGSEAFGGEAFGGEAFGGEDLGGELGGSDLEGMCSATDEESPCVTCDDLGAFGAPPSDPECPNILCPTQAYTTEVDMNGVTSCYRDLLSAPTEVICDDVGVCADPSTLMCTIVERELIAGADSCQTFSGCVGDDPPMTTDFPDGALCNQWGRCEDGACSAPLFCAHFERYNNENIFCDGGTLMNGIDACLFYVNRIGNLFNNGEPITCDQFCENTGNGATCADGWNNSNGASCNFNQNNSHGCDQAFNDQICLCDLSDFTP